MLIWPFDFLVMRVEVPPVAGIGGAFIVSKSVGLLARGKLYVVRELRALTPEEFERAAEKLRNPAPGSRIEAAKNYGIDLTLLIEQLRLTPEERVRKLQGASQAMQQGRGVARRRR